MTWEDLASGVSDVVMATFGVSGTYYSRDIGAVDMDPALGQGIDLQRGVVLEDDEGLHVRQDIATIRAGLVKPRSEDWFQIGTSRWRVVHVVEHDGYLIRLQVAPRLP